MAGRETEAILKWVRASEETFNTALRLVADTENKFEPDTEPNKGYFTINGQKIFTGEGYCEDGCWAYGKAIRRLFPDLKLSLKYLQLSPLYLVEGQHLLYGHYLLLCLLNSNQFFIDPTFGQIINEPNKVFVGDYSYRNILKVYDPIEIDYETEQEFFEIYHFSNPELVGNHFFLRNFTGSPVNDGVIRIRGRDTSPSRYLLEKLLEVPRTD